jgi:hypothetical protein
MQNPAHIEKPFYPESDGSTIAEAEVQKLRAEIESFKQKS